MRVKRYTVLTIIVLCAILSIVYLRRDLSVESLTSRYDLSAPPTSHLRPIEQADDTTKHPIETLVADNEKAFHALVDKQSKSLKEAVAEYKRRYGMPPPPRFDDWFKYAHKSGTPMIDEYDTIHHALLPFWGLQPATIRARVREALGFDGNALLAVMIRNGNVSHHQAGAEWQQVDTVKMMQGFIKMLPDMDLAFNIHDEPRVVLPHDDLDRLVKAGKQRQMTLTGSKDSFRNAFSDHPQDLWSGNRVEEFKTSRFNEHQRQSVWIPSRLSCSPESPARALEEDRQLDAVDSYAFGQLNFISNHTAFTDVCNTPTLATNHGFFERPNVYNVVHDLVPIFSQSKVSSYQDILYPSPWYWDAEKVVVDQAQDPDWTEKTSDLFWVGSTTGGYSMKGGWRNHHRQRIVRQLNAKDKATIMMNRASIDLGSTIEDGTANWTTKTVDRTDYKDMINVHFSDIGQCEKHDCTAQKEFFKVVPKVKFNDFWSHKFLLDMDGNAFSGRFHAFLKSKSLPVKMNIFREWSEEWIRPWVHYVPFGIKGEEVLEEIRWFIAGDDGRGTAERLASQGKTWAEKTLRNEDMEVWLFRLLLEYARVIDDDRDKIGFDM